LKGLLKGKETEDLVSGREVGVCVLLMTSGIASTSGSAKREGLNKVAHWVRIVK